MRSQFAVSGNLQPQVSLAPFTTLRTGGPAEWFARITDVDTLADLAIESYRAGIKTTIIGWGSNLLPSDAGVPGVVVHNAASTIEIHSDGTVVADCGCCLQELFLKATQAGFVGLEYAVGIPGSLGGALVSNAGAYRSNVSEFLVELDVVADGVRQWVTPEWMQFSYRNSVLRSTSPRPCALLRAKMRLAPGNPRESYDEAREYQRQRISKQPPPASAGSFFKNVENAELARSLARLPDRLKEAGIVPAGYLIQEAGLAGARLGGAMFATRHANFMLNVGGATATEIRSLAEYVIGRVNEQFGVELEEEVLYVGDWSQYRRLSV